ncbi:MAG: DNA polymerase III subunit gamma/tau [Lachnospiraceae bacterium]|jgi:DNA polymerase-3 subunit gamma/tau|nr:DNA polymerase III subunit gamma/tau [Lachnospiraceae bacterium]
MSYQALYRKFRPHRFKDVKGQDPIITTLKNEIIRDRIGHAYLFSGTRGTGKTTVAKIFAQAVNCESPIDGEPCGTCEACKDIENGSSMNVIEIDAASNNGVDNVRQIREDVTYRPTSGKYKVYIIDEAHMLSTSAWNAFLKTLEEPPEYVIFIFATTEANKIPITISSRCQKYEFKRITVEVIEERLKEVMALEGDKATDEAIRYIAVSADGALRDALSLLDQCIAYHPDTELTYENVLSILGSIDTETFSDVFQKIIGKDVTILMDKVSDIVNQGKDLQKFVTDFLWYLRSILLVKSSDDLMQVLGVSKEAFVQMRENGKLISFDELIRYIRTFSDLIPDMKNASEKRILLEISLIKLCLPVEDTAKVDIADVASETTEKKYQEATESDAILSMKVEKLVDREVKKLIQSGELAPQATEVKPKINKEKPKPILMEALEPDLQRVLKDFRKIIAPDSYMKVSLKNVRLTVIDNKIVLVPTDDLAYEFLTNPISIKSEEYKTNIAKLTAMVENYIGKRVELNVKPLESSSRFEENYSDAEEAAINFTIETSDEFEDEE